MLIRFKSKASADVIMLDVHAKRLLEMMGKTDCQKGIVCAEDLPQALLRLDQALEVLENERKRQQTLEQPNGLRSDGDAHEVSWSQRAQPLQKMLRMAIKDNTSVTWGA